MKTEENYVNPKRRKCKAFYFNENKNVNLRKNGNLLQRIESRQS